MSRSGPAGYRWGGHKLSSRLVWWWWGTGRALEGLCLGQGHSGGSDTLKPIGGSLVHTFLALASPPAGSTRTAVGIWKAEGETPAACCAWALFLAALPKTTLSAG